MAQFRLTARSDINRSNGFHIDRGTEIVININVQGITPDNLFGNSRCRDQLVKQFKQHDIDLPLTDPVFTRGCWDIKMSR